MGLARHSIPHLTIDTIRQTIRTPHLSRAAFNFNFLVTFDFSPYSGSEGWLGGDSLSPPHLSLDNRPTLKRLYSATWNRFHGIGKIV